MNSTKAKRLTWSAILSFVLIAVVACSGAANTPTATPIPTTQPPSAAPPSKQVASPGQPTGTTSTLQIGLASSDLGIGLNRIAFGIIDSRAGPIRGADVEVRTFFLAELDQDTPVETKMAVFQEWPVSPRGIYTAQLNFDKAGAWGIGIVVKGTDGVERQTSTSIQVKETTLTPAIGSPAPRSTNKTSADVSSLAQITTDLEPDPELYNMTIAEAIDENEPLMIVFSTPAYCQTATCGPQLDVIKEIKDVYKDRINVIHIEVYDNPQEIQGDLSNAVISPTLEEWGLPTEPWTFILDKGGLVQAKFEAFTTRQELEEALLNVLQ